MGGEQKDMTNSSLLPCSYQTRSALLWCAEESEGVTDPRSQVLAHILGMVVRRQVDARVLQPVQVGCARVAHPGLSFSEPPARPGTHLRLVPEPEGHDEHLFQILGVAAGPERASSDVLTSSLNTAGM